VWEKLFAAGSVSAGPSAVYAAGGEEVRRYDLNGNLIWATNVESAVVGLEADLTGIYVVGSAPISNSNGMGFAQRNGTLARLDSNGNIVWSRELTTSSFSETTSWATAVTIQNVGYFALP
jgi:hypothetical protein